MTDQYNNIDYYGPVRVTGVHLAFYRPEQNIETLDPKYYYFYELQKTLEWGGSWGCPSKENLTWCSAGDDLYKDQCRVRIDCNGRPQDYPDGGVVGECASAEKKVEAFEKLILSCLASAADNERLHLSDFSSNTNLTNREIAPWDDPLNPHTVTRSVTCDAFCTARVTSPPQKLVHDAFLEWIVGGSLVLLGSALLLRGVVNGQEQEAVFQRVQARIVFRTEVNESDVSHDLELTSNTPVAYGVPSSQMTSGTPVACGFPTSQMTSDTPVAYGVPVPT